MTAGDPRDVEHGSMPDLPTLLGDEYETLEAILSGEVDGPVAVVGDPLSGRGAVLDRVARELDSARIALDSGDGVDGVRPAIEDGSAVIEDCQHLYQRRVGGFTELSAFLDAMAGADGTVVTGWNRYAWAYLSAVRDLDSEFPVTVELRALPAERLAELILDRYDTMPTFVAEDPANDGLVATTRREIGWRGRSVSVPVPTVRPLVTGSWLSDDEPDPKDVTFGRLAAVSDGNLGVATAIWETGRNAEMRPSDVGVPASDRDLDREEAFCLRIVLAKERVDRAQLSRIVDGLDRVLGRLSRDGLVAVEGDVVTLVPAAIPTAAAATERERIL